MSDITWVVVADGARARVFQTEPAMEAFSEVHDLVHYASRERTSELVTDQGGGHGHGMGARSGPQSGNDAHDHEEQRFAAQVADALKSHIDTYVALVIVASPRFLGMLRTALDTQVAGKVTAELGKDYTKLDPDAIRHHVKGHLSETPLLG